MMLGTPWRCWFSRGWACNQMVFRRYACAAEANGTSVFKGFEGRVRHALGSHSGPSGNTRR